VVIHDSMGEVIVPLLRPYLEEAVTVRTRAGSSFGVGGAWFPALLDGADLLVFQTVERELVGRFDGTLPLQLIGALADRMPHTPIEVGGTVDLGTGADRFVVAAGEPGAVVRITAGGVVAETEVGPAGTAAVDLSRIQGSGILNVEGSITRVTLVRVP
jgi:hypothetical protein